MTEHNTPYDCRTCVHSNYDNKVVFECELAPGKRYRPRRCREYDMDQKFASEAKSIKGV